MDGPKKLERPLVAYGKRNTDPGDTSDSGSSSTSPRACKRNTMLVKPTGKGQYSPGPNVQRLSMPEAKLVGRSPSPRRKPPPVPAKPGPVTLAKEPVSHVLKSSWLILNKQPQKKYVELHSECVLLVFTEIGVCLASCLGLMVSGRTALRRTMSLATPISIHDELDEEIATLEGFPNYDEMEEWVQFMEGLNWKLINTARQSDFNIKDGWLNHDLNIWVGTWNVGNTVPEKIGNWIDLASGDYDILVVGSQECTYKSGLSQSETDWYQRVAHAIRRQSENYQLVQAHSLMEIRCMVFVKKVHWPYVSQVKSSSVATGLGNVVGNKGGVGISFSFHTTTFLFISSHLAAHQERICARNTNYKDIMRRMRMGRTLGIPDLTYQADSR